MGLSPEQFRYLLIGHFFAASVINFVLNGAIGLLAFRGVDPVSTWGVESSAGPDLIGTCLFLPAITCLIVTGIVHRHLRAGAVEALSPDALPVWLAGFQRPLVNRSLRFGMAGLLLIGGPLALVLVSLGPQAVALTPFLWLKAGFSAALAGLVTPLIGLVALADAEPDPLELADIGPEPQEV